MPVERFRAVAAKYAPPFIRLRWKRGSELQPAHAKLHKLEILSPRPDTIEGLAFFVHEASHFWQKHFTEDELPDTVDVTTRAMLRDLYVSARPPATVAEMEYEAERWTIGVLRFEGLSVPQHVNGMMREYVAELIDEDTAKRRSPRHVRRWVR